VLFFGSRVIWFCNSMTKSDGGVEDWAFDENATDRISREFQIELSKADRKRVSSKTSVGESSKDLEDAGKYKIETGSITTGSNDRDIYDLWHRIVGDYSRRAMSRPEDKFLAISAVTAEFARISGDTYVAGLWESNLTRDLLWSTPHAAVSHNIRGVMSLKA